MADAKGKEKVVDAAWLAMIDELEDESNAEGRDMEGEFCWNDFDEPEGPEDLDNVVNNPSNLSELINITCDPDATTPDLITPFGNTTNDVPDEGTYTTTYGADELAGSAESSMSEIDLYDSGASRHMSGFRHKFVEIVEIDPVPITAADKHTFLATAKENCQYIFLTEKKETRKYTCWTPCIQRQWVSRWCQLAASQKQDKLLSSKEIVAGSIIKIRRGSV